MNPNSIMKDFEFERRFFCEEFPADLQQSSEAVFHVQSYFLANEGYNIRVRTTSKDVKVDMCDSIDINKVLEDNYDHFGNSFITVKAPSVGGSRYEAEREIDPGVAIELILRGGSKIVKNRFSVWIKSDAWVVDIFGNSNFGLIIAECERDNPVTDLEIPAFCISEITDDFDFTNDNLSVRPFPKFKDRYLKKLASEGGHFSQDFGENHYLD